MSSDTTGSSFNVFALKSPASSTVELPVYLSEVGGKRAQGRLNLTRHEGDKLDLFGATLTLNELKRSGVGAEPVAPRRGRECPGGDRG